MQCLLVNRRRRLGSITSAVIGAASTKYVLRLIDQHASVPLSANKLTATLSDLANQP
ncbi:MAG: hypothetical protein HZB13_00830 [Acidobacteria bacterium]|nr:hypothetical protein [Acidobacteriota bacterium]